MFLSEIFRKFLANRSLAEFSAANMNFADVVSEDDTLFVNKFKYARSFISSFFFSSLCYFVCLKR